MSSMPPSSSAPQVPNNLIWAILSTLFCCLPLGIVSIVFAAKVDGLRNSGDINGAQEASRKARNWAIAAAVSGPVFMILYFVVFGGLAALGGM